MSFTDASANRALVVLLRHAQRPPLPEGETGNALPLTERGREQAFAFGRDLAGPVCTLRSSPLSRCVQTAEALRSGAGIDVAIKKDEVLGDPGVYVLDAELARGNWRRLGRHGVLAHLVARSDPLPGMADPEFATRRLIEHMLTVANGRAGWHFFISHDALVAPLAARVLGRALPPEQYPDFLDGVTLWHEQGSLGYEYRGHQGTRPWTRY
ncbi:MAG: histidine phosphatase family protein [Gammaproteobacteria bacterium]|nr:histidine phosphatase family protein [Gammaproteobacteria bacterium]